MNRFARFVRFQNNASSEDMSLCVANPLNYKDIPNFPLLLNLHSSILGILHGLLFLFASFMLLRLVVHVKQRRPFIIALHLLLIAFALFRVVFVTAQGHVKDQQMQLILQIVGDLGIPALTSAFALVVWVMSEISQLKVMNRKLQKKRILIGMILFHFILIIIIDISVGFAGTCWLLLTCQLFNILWGFTLTILFFFVTKKIYRTSKELERTFRERAFSNNMLEMTTGRLGFIALAHCDTTDALALGQCSGGPEERRDSVISLKDTYPYLLNQGSPHNLTSYVNACGDALNLFTVHLEKGGVQMVNNEAMHDDIENKTSRKVNKESETINGKNTDESDAVTSRQTSAGNESLEETQESERPKYSQNGLHRSSYNESQTLKKPVPVPLKTPQIHHEQVVHSTVQLPSTNMDVISRDRTSPPLPNELIAGDYNENTIFRENLEFASVIKPHKQKSNLGEDPVQPRPKPPIARKPNYATISAHVYDVSLENKRNLNTALIENKSNEKQRHVEGKRSFKASDGTDQVSNKNTNNNNGPPTPVLTITKPTRSRLVSNRIVNPTRKLQIVGFTTVILGVVSILLGIIGTSYIYNPLLTGTEMEPDPLIWLIYISVLRFVEYLFALLLTVLAWQKSSKKT
ncbi:uncharacterized protein [Apostichopus japonicus]|uniref:uncharacterized protein n=1 Tax=Stichopus japonicus TaxID=307972 RepID=UPI003AB7C281